ncbi:MAG: dihydropteroate synthase [Acidimicrobiia bacterium]
MSPDTWRIRAGPLQLSRGLLMGVLNVTPDSFSDGGLYFEESDAMAAAQAMVAQGADLIDVGGESTRPGAQSVDVAEEIRRVLPVIARLAEDGVAVSVDTSKTSVAREAIAAGASVINDVTGAGSPGMVELMADSGAGVVVMHMQGTPRDMQVNPSYDDVVAEVAAWLSERAQTLIDRGISGESIAVDPGIGFGKTVSHNLDLLSRLHEIADLGFPVVLGTSRKSFLGKLTGIEDPARRDEATAITTAMGFERGARIFRVHDVARSRAALGVAAAIVTPQQWEEWSQG